jgi:peptidoglycan/LPS O-acetylase OafA/YrhL
MSPFMPSTSTTHSISDPDPEFNPGFSTNIPEFDGLRGLAILAVFLFHYVGVTGTTLPRRFVSGAAASGWIGVDLFFVLSGFLITRILLTSRNRPRYFRNFYARRSLRIFPLYFGFLLALFGLPLLLGIKNPDLGILSKRQWWLWAYCTNIGAVIHGKDYFVVGKFWVLHFWTLAIEEQFYLVWPLVALLASPRILVAICWSIVFGTPVARLISSEFLHTSIDAIYYLTPFRADAFACGALVAIASIRGVLHRYRALFRGVTAATAILILAVAVSRGSRGLSGLDQTPVSLLLSALAVLFASVMGCVLTAPEQNVANRALRCPWLRRVGRYSYGLYVIHFPLAPVIEHFFGAMRIVRLGVPYAVAGLIHLTVGFIICFTLAALLFHLFEAPFLRLKRYFEPSVSTYPDSKIQLHRSGKTNGTTLTS